MTSAAYDDAADARGYGWGFALERPWRDWSLRLNVQNLTDRVYYDALYDNGGFGVPGTRRRVLLTAQYKF